MKTYSPRIDVLTMKPVIPAYGITTQQAINAINLGLLAGTVLVIAVCVFL